MSVKCFLESEVYLHRKHTAESNRVYIADVLFTVSKIQGFYDTGSQNKGQKHTVK